MRLLPALLLVLIARPVLGEPAQTLPVKEIKTGTLESIRITAPTPKVTAEVNRAIGLTVRASGWGSPNPTTITCHAELATDRIVSWRCDYRTNDGMTGGVQSRALIIDGDTTRDASEAALFGANAAKLAKLTGADGCQWKTDDQAWVVTIQGIESIPAYQFSGCMIGWATLEPLLPANSPLKAVLGTTTPTALQPNWAKAPARFIAQADGVLDRATGLVWAAQDNGADLTWEAATTYARNYRGGNHADWRLPTDEELEVFAQPETPHKEKADCTKGASYLLSTPLVKLSCGLAWSSTAVDKRRSVAFGFLSGTPRISPITDSKNYRALVVRKP